VVLRDKAAEETPEGIDPLRENSICMKGHMLHKVLAYKATAVRQSIRKERGFGIKQNTRGLDRSSREYDDFRLLFVFHPVAIEINYTFSPAFLIYGNTGHPAIGLDLDLPVASALLW
jgi:hypothetical protein